MVSLSFFSSRRHVILSTKISLEQHLLIFRIIEKVKNVLENEKRDSTTVAFRKFQEIFKNSFFVEHLR